MEILCLSISIGMHGNTHKSGDITSFNAAKLALDTFHRSLPPPHCKSLMASAPRVTMKIQPRKHVASVRNQLMRMKRVRIKSLPSSQPNLGFILYLVYNRTATMGVEKHITTTQMTMKTRSLLGGLASCECSPGGGVIAGVREGFGFEDIVLMNNDTPA